MSQSALLIGATGLIGKLILPALVSATSKYTRVGEFGRRVTADLVVEDKNKLVQKAIDFDKIQEAGLKDESWDVVYITLGTTKAIAGSKEAFTKIDKEYVVNAAKEARVPGKKQRLVYLSSAGASSSSPIFYSKSKGLTEEALAQIGYDEFIALRPGMFTNVDRSGTNRANDGGLPWIQRVVELVAPTIDVKYVATAVRLAGELGATALPAEAAAANLSTDISHPHTVIYNAGCIALAKTAE